MPAAPPRWTVWIVAAVAGVVSYLSFRPAGWWFAAPAALALLYLTLRTLRPWRGFAVALVFGLAQFLPMLTWAYNAAGVLPYLALSLTSAALLALSAVLYGYARFLLRDRSASVPDAVLFALAFTAADTFRQFFPFGGFPWGRLGFTQAVGPMARWAWLGGVPLVGLAAALAGSALGVAVLALTRWRGPARAGGGTRARAAAANAARSAGTASTAGPKAGSGTGSGAGTASGAGKGSRRGPAASAGAGSGVARAGRPGGSGGRWRTFAWAVALAAAAVLLPLTAPINAAAQGGSLKVGAVQGDVEVTSEGLFARQREVLENHVEVSRELAAQVAAKGERLDIVLWPENSTDIDPRTDEQAYASIEAAADELGVPVLVGAMEYVNRSNRYNQGLLWQPGLGVVEVYAKRHPAPFAEYMPARSFFRLFTSKVDLINTDMLPGSEVGVMRFDGAALGREVALGDIICFEVAYDSIVADVVREGAEVVVVQTNNASFGFSEESTQQFAMARLRAIEHGRATVQISTVGVSAAIAPDGSLLTPLTSLYEPAYFIADLPLRTSITPATRIGDAVCWALMIGPLGLAVAGVGARLAKVQSARRRRPTA